MQSDFSTCHLLDFLGTPHMIPVSMGQTEYRKVRADAKQLKKLDRLNAEYDSNITYVEARELISKLEKQLAPTPSVCKALKRYGEDPANYTREKADRFLEEKEQEEENKAMSLP